MRIAFFGGSFDPVHNAHVALAAAVLKRGLSDRVVAAPAFDQPFKPSGAQTSFEDRAEMLRLAFDGVSGVEVSEIERELALRPSYTAAVVAELRRRRPECRWQLLIGADSLAELHRWHDAAQLVEECDFLVYPRSGIDVGAAALRRNGWPEATALRLANAVLDLPFNEISATVLRKKLANGENTATFIPVRVLEYIKEKKLYRTGGKP